MRREIRVDKLVVTSGTSVAVLRRGSRLPTTKITPTFGNKTCQQEANICESTSVEMNSNSLVLGQQTKVDCFSWITEEVTYDLELLLMILLSKNIIFSNCKRKSGEPIFSDIHCKYYTLPYPSLQRSSAERNFTKTQKQTVQ